MSNITNACTCGTTCVGVQCTCGCQNANKAQRACLCGDACNCGPDCSCKK